MRSWERVFLRPGNAVLVDNDPRAWIVMGLSRQGGQVHAGTMVALATPTDYPAAQVRMSTRLEKLTRLEAVHSAEQ